MNLFLLKKTNLSNRRLKSNLLKDIGNLFQETNSPKNSTSFEYQTSCKQINVWNSKKENRQDKYHKNLFSLYIRKCSKDAVKLHIFYDIHFLARL
jgi:hypothetical protein